MKFTGKTVVQKCVAMLIILVMTLADIALIGANVISYAVDMVATNSNNVEFCAYFLNSNNEKLTNIESAINDQNLKMQIEVSVKNEGYFNGEVELENANFKFKGDNSNQYVKNVEENKITLNKINAGDTAIIQLGVTFAGADEFEPSTLNKESKVNLKGTYVNSKKDKEIKGSTKLQINWKSPNGINATLGTKVLTNSIYKINDANKRIVQVLVNSQINNNAYPVKNTNIEMSVPEGVEEVKVHSRVTNATNGNAEFNENNYNYNQENNTLTINIANEAKDGKIKWNKNAQDFLVVTYIYSENVNLLNADINAKSVITTYDDQQLKTENNLKISEDIDGIITNEMREGETQIYKGKIYTGERREYTSTTVLNVDYAEIAQEIEISEQEPAYMAGNEIKDANIEYVQSKIKKSEFDKIFGTDGTLEVLDQDKNTIASINKDSSVDDNGYITINYKAGTIAISIKTSKPVSNGILNIEHKKAMLDSKLSRKDIRNLTAIKENVETDYKKSDETTNINKAETRIALKETSSAANIKISEQKLSTVEKNTNVKLVATLEANDESKDLYKNPKVKIVFPKEIKDIKITDATSVYRNGLEKPKSSKSVNKNGNIVINLDFSGEQTNYDSKILNGSEVYFNAEIDIDKSTPSKEAKIEMEYSNENGKEKSYKTETKVYLESQYGLMLYNKVENYNSKKEVVETTNENKVEAKLDRNAKNTKPLVTTTLINNYDKDVKNVEVIGNIPSKDDKNTFNTSLSNLKVNSKAEILYNKNANAKANDKNWTKNSEGAKSYKVNIEEIKLGKTAQITYNLNVEDDLAYNEVGNLTTNVNVNDGNKVTTKTSNVELATEKAIVKVQTAQVEQTKTGLEISKQAILGGNQLKDGSTVHEGETIKYITKITNKTDKDYNNVKAVATQTNGKIYDLVKERRYNPEIYGADSWGEESFWKVTDSNVKEFETINIPSGKTVTFEYQAVVQKSETAETYGNIAINSADKALTENITTIKNKVEDAELELNFVSVLSDDFEWQSKTGQQANLYITNKTNENLKNVKVQIIFSKNWEFDVRENTNLEVINKEINSSGQTVITLNVKEILANQKEEIYVTFMISDFEGEKDNVEFYAAATTAKNEEYLSNNNTRLITQTRKNIKVEQFAKINDKDIDKNTVANDGDKVDFYVTINNNEKEKLKLYINDYIQKGLNIKNITLVNNDKTKQDITENYSERRLTYEIELDANKQIGIIISGVIDTSSIGDSRKIVNEFIVDDLTRNYSATTEFGVNVVIPDDKKLNVTAVQEAKIANGTTIKNGDKVEYTIKLSNTCGYDRTINVYDYISASIRDVKVSMNNEDITKKYLKGNDLTIENYKIKANTDASVKIEGTINLVGYDSTEILNEAIVKSSLADTKTNTITYYTPKEVIEEGNNQNGDNSNGNENNGEQSVQNTENYTVKGKVWIDSNENGKRDDKEEIFKDITVIAVNTQTGETLSTTATTGEDGSYELTLPQGKYIIAFLYNNEDYRVTTYQAKNVNADVNSDVVSKQLSIDNKNITVGATDVIDLSSNIENIDMGLLYRNKFDLKLNKSVTKMVVTNDGGTETYDFDDSQLAKAEIHSKYLNGSTVVVEYKIKVTNVGDIAGRVNSIVDYMPKDMTFSSNLNKDWYKKGDYLYNESLENTNLDAGESKEITLVLTKKMTESNTGLVNNSAAIQSSYNSKSFSDIDSDNNNSSADVIISVKTGAAVKLVLLTLSLVIVIAGVAYLIMRNYLNKKI